MVKSFWTPQCQLGLRWGARVLYARPSLMGQASWAGAPGWASSRGAAPALCSPEQAAEGRGLWLRSPRGGLKRGVKGSPAALVHGTPQFIMLSNAIAQPSPATLPDRSDCQPHSTDEGVQRLH